MKPKLILAAVLAAAISGAAGWFAPHPATVTTNAVAVTATNTTASDRKILYYACPMHPNIKYNHPGDCPICGMKLQPVYADETGTNSRTALPGCCSLGTNP